MSDMDGASSVYDAMAARGVQPDACTFIPLFKARASMPRGATLEEYHLCVGDSTLEMHAHEGHGVEADAAGLVPAVPKNGLAGS